MANDDRAAVQAGVDVKMMLTFRLAEALGYDAPILDFDDLCDRVRAFAAPYPAVEREALAALFRAAPNRERSPLRRPRSRWLLFKDICRARESRCRFSPSRGWLPWLSFAT